MGQHLYFCTCTHTSPPGYNSRDGMQAARKARSGLGAALPPAGTPGVPSGSFWVAATRQGGSLSEAGALCPPGPGLHPGQGPHGLVARRPLRLALGGGTRDSTYSVRPHSCCSVVRPAHQPLP